MDTPSHYRVTFEPVEEPKGMATASPRHCLACHTFITGMGGGGDYICASCLHLLHRGVFRRYFQGGVTPRQLMRWRPGELPDDPICWSNWVALDEQFMERAKGHGYVFEFAYLDPASPGMVNDLAMALKRLAGRARRFDSLKPAADTAIDFLSRKGLIGSPLRGEANEH